MPFLAVNCRWIAHTGEALERHWGDTGETNEKNYLRSSLNLISFGSDNFNSLFIRSRLDAVDFGGLKLFLKTEDLAQK